MKYGLVFSVVGWMVWTQTSMAASVRAETVCPLDPLENCRWEVRVQTKQQAGALAIHIDWEKSLISRHRDKPLAKALQCNVDRDFNEAAHGYIRVWFRGETQACDPTRRNPADCGVTFHLDDPRDLHTASGLTVVAPTGKTLDRVEHYSTLNLQCGNFEPNRARYSSWNWNARVGWSADRSGDGLYVENAAPTPIPAE